METGHLLVVCAAVLGAVQAGQHDIYSGHSVYGVHVRSKAHQMLLHDLEPILDLDVWQHGIVSEREAFIRVAPITVHVLSQLSENHKADTSTLKQTPNPVFV